MNSQRKRHVAEQASQPHGAESRRRPLLSWLALSLLALACAAQPARAAIQFDVFLGYDGFVPEASWFPVVFEIKNDGPSFAGTVEIEVAYNQGQTVRTAVELPTGTLKRIVLPVFCNTRSYTAWNAQLLDERGRVRAEQTSIRARRQLARGTPLMGALPRSAGSAPVIRQGLTESAELQPAAARLLPSIFPDNPLVLEGMTSLYLNSERAAELSQAQVNALLAWLHAGGHLIVAVEQPTDINSSPWLKTIFPVAVKDLRGVLPHPELHDWLRNPSWSAGNYFAQGRPGSYPSASPRPPSTIDNAANPFADLANDLDFEAKELQVAVGQLRAGEVVVSAADTPLIVTAHFGRGRLTGLLFSPEREPARSWKNLPTFWAKLADVPGALYVSKELFVQGGWSSDGVFGSMIDSRQVHKLPIGWLLVLLLAYLVVIGPLDQYWLKRIGKPMLTWITFPCYVVVFSLVIYLIGYKLRAGESEWNDLHVVDVLFKGDRAELRGRTYSSVYSPVNQRYRVQSQQKCATLRGETAGYFGSGQSAQKATIDQHGDTFRGEIFVPVWTSELFISDWWHSAEAPLRATVSALGTGWRVNVENRGDQKLAQVHLAIGDRLLSLGELAPRQSKNQDFGASDGQALREFVQRHGVGFSRVVSSRQRALGSTESGQIEDRQNASVAVSFLSQMEPHSQLHNNFISPPGLDLTSSLDQGAAVLLAWAPGYSPVKPIYDFTPRRSQRDTLWRLAVPIAK